MFLYSTPDNKIYDSVHRQFSAVNSFLLTIILYLQQLGSKGSEECKVTEELGTFTQIFNKLDVLDVRPCACLLP